MTTREMAPPPGQGIRGRVMQIDRQQADYRKQGLSRTDSQVRRVLDSKASLLIEALGMRQGGDDNIKLNVMGQEQEGLHAYSSNDVEIHFFDQEAQIKWYGSRAHLRILRENCSGNLMNLIGAPDKWVPEYKDTRIRRLFAEVIDIGAAVRRVREVIKISQGMGRNLSKVGENLSQVDDLNRLKVIVAERIFATPPQELVARGKLIVDRDVNNVAVVRWLPTNGKEMGFSLLQREHITTSPILMEAIASYVSKSPVR